MPRMWLRVTTLSLFLVAGSLKIWANQKPAQCRDFFAAPTWQSYNRAKRGMGPSDFLKEVLRTKGLRVGEAYDLGAGSGNESFELASQGWTVTAIEADSGSARDLKADKRFAKVSGSLKVLELPFEKAKLHPIDLIVSRQAIPFLTPSEFPRVWRSMVENLRRGGLMSIDFFGPKDFRASPLKTILTFEQVVALAGSDLEVLEVFKTEGLHGEAFWQMYTLHARKK